MATEFNGIVYFPTKATFFEGAVSESLEAKYGIKGPYLVIKILCKIYKEGYYIQWDEEQCEIFAYKLGREYTKEEVDSIIGILIEKGFFDKNSYEEHRILTSVDIQRVWLEATSRRKRDLTKLPYLLEEVKCKEEEIKCKQKESTNSENANIFPVQMELSLENADIFRQSKVKESKVEEKKKKKEEEDSILPPPPEYALNKKTHIYDGLLLELERIKVTDTGDIKAILRMSNYGEIGTPVWKVLAQTSWAKIGMPGKYLIKILRSS